MVEQLPRAVVGVEALARKQRHEVQPRAEVNGLGITTEVQLDERCARGQLGVDVEVLEPHRRAGEKRERLRMAFAQGLRHGEAVHQRGQTAAGLIHQAMQQLDPGYRRAIGIVGVRIKCQRRVSEVVGIGCGAHVEQRTEIRLARETEHRTQLEHHARLGGHALENHESESQECFQPRAQLGRARVGAPARPRQLGERAVPQPRRGAIVAGGRERRFREDLLGVETRFMSVAEFDPVSTRQRLRHRHQRELNIEVRRILQPLLRLQIDAGRIPAALAQPQRMDGVLTAVGALQHQLGGPTHLHSRRSLLGRHERQSSVAT